LLLGLILAGCPSKKHADADAGMRDDDSDTADAAVASGGHAATGGSSGSSGVAGSVFHAAGVGGVLHTFPGDSSDSGVPMLRSTPGITDCGSIADCMSYPRQPNNSPEGQPYCCTSSLCAPGNLAWCESGVPYYCDEAADCESGLHCCRAGIRTLYSCQPSCDDEPQLCKTDAECENGEACTPYNCANQVRGFCGVKAERRSGCSLLE
jgi:hypothetical protein